MIDFAATLNEEQLAAVTHPGGPQLVIAGAGSGKTRVITYRIAWLVQQQGVHPSQIAAVTFTNKAAAEMRERVEELLGLHPLPTSVGTFHRFALRLLRMYGPKVGLARDFSILDSSDQLTLVKRSMKAAGVPDDSFRPQAVLAAISGAKNKLIGPARYDRDADEFFSRKVAPVYQHYQAMMREANGIDFDDMIRLSVQLLREQDAIRKRVQKRFRFLLVDEFQDTNHAQLQLISHLCGEPPELTAVGDEDQGIYRWRGAELANILQFERSFPGAVVRKLERNYRSTQTILDASGGVVANNESRRGKRLWTDAGDGDQIILFRARDEQDEARWVTNTLSSLEDKHGWPNMAVLMRTNAQTRALEDAFLRRGIPYNLVAGVRFYERAEIKDLVAYLRLLRNPNDSLSFERSLNRPARGIGKTTQSKLQRAAADDSTSMWQLIQSDDRLDALLPTRSARAVRRFRDLVHELRRLADGLPLPALLRQLLDATGFLDQYDADDSDDRGRLENIQEMLSAAQEFTEQNAYGAADTDDLMAAFLDHVSLVSDTDGLGGPGVAVMTLHSAKGLEFDVVVITGLEEDLLPHFNAQSEAEDLEEERRLLYVGMTRAKQRLMITTCSRRRVAGTYQDRDESRFVGEIPSKFLIVETSPQLFSGPASYASGSSYGRQHSTTSTVSKTSKDDIYAFFGRPAPAEAASTSGTAAAAEPLSLPFVDDEPSPSATADRHDRVSSRGGRMKRGSRVRHSKLGIGKVMSIEGTGDDARLTVYFESKGRRKLIAKYANLDVL